jgi:hypothetical protein
MVARDMVSNPWSVAGVAVKSSMADRLTGGVSGCRGADDPVGSTGSIREFTSELGGECL